MKNAARAAMVGLIVAAIAAPLSAQETAHEAAMAPPPPPPAPAPAGAPAGRGVPVPSGFQAFPVVPAMVERGKSLFAASCASCHAMDIRGTDKGPNLRRSTFVLNDLGNGKMTGLEVRENLGHKGAFANLGDKDAADLTHYLKSFPPLRQGAAEIGIPARFVVGDAGAGRTLFAANCSACHATTPGAASASTNLAGIGARIADPKALQQAWLAPTTAKVTTAIVTMKDGSRVEGPASAPSEFTLTVTVNGTPRVINRDEAAKIDIAYPLTGHARLLGKLSDTNIHDVTGYLASLK